MMKPVTHGRFVLALAWLAMAWMVGASAQQPDLAEGTPVLAAPWSNDQSKFTFIVIGDRRGGRDDEWPVFDRAVDEINLLRPDFAIMVGDQIEGGLEDPDAIAAQWKDFRDHADRLRMPLFVLPGNHDISNPIMLRWWKENVGRTYYSFDYKGCHFLVLNAHEDWVENDSTIGPEQLRFALEDLERSRGARHTFVFMHPPLWTDPSNTYWQRIEAALRDRKHTVIAGHTHRLTHERRGENRYLVVGTTKGAVVPWERGGILQMGGFPHYTQITVDGDETHVAIIEPAGSVWPEDVAPRSFQEAARNLARVEPIPPQETSEGLMRTGLAVHLTNGLPEPVEMSVEISPTGDGGWRPLDEPARTITLAPGSTQKVEFLFDASAEDVVPVPRVRFRAAYAGQTLYGFERNAPLYPETALREIPEWQVVGPFEAGPVTSTLPEDPRAALPKLFATRGPERGRAAGSKFDDEGQPRTWRLLQTEGQFLNLARLCETPTCVLAYAQCGVYSPTDRTVHAEFRADDYAQIFVNGVGIEDERLFRTRSDATYVELPLKAGWNTLVVKGVNIGGGWTFRLLTADPAGELRFAPDPE